MDTVSVIDTDVEYSRGDSLLQVYPIIYSLVIQNDILDVNHFSTYIILRPKTIFHCTKIPTIDDSIVAGGQQLLLQ
jgi:hypothetical protein